MPIGVPLVLCLCGLILLFTVLAVHAGCEPRCYHLSVWAEGWGLTPDAHICTRCGQDKGSGLGVQSLPRGFSLSWNLTIASKILFHPSDSLWTRAPYRSAHSLRSAGLGRVGRHLVICACRVWYLVPNKGLCDSFPSLPSVPFTPRHQTWINRTIAYHERHIFLKPVSTA